jgi:hypothetical protein
MVVYLDDILIFSKTRDDHVNHICEVLKHLKENHLYCQLEKCSFFLPEVDYLGIIASGEGIWVDPTKVAQAVDWPVPKNVKNVQEFLGFANFYRRFIVNYSKIAHPLFDLLHKDQSWKWTPREEKALDDMKSALQSAPVLIQPDPYKEFFLECDTSDFATGTILSQKRSDGKLHPVAFLSKSLSPAEKNYDIFDKGLLAIIRAFKEWRHLLEGSDIPIQVLTDHRNLEHFSGMKPLNQRQIRWANFLADYNFVIKYRLGVQNKKADLLSRRADLVPPKEGGEPSMLLKPELFIAAIQTDLDLDDTIRDTLQDDPNASKVIEQLNSGEKLNGWKINNGLLYFQEHIFVPQEKEIRKAVIESRHDAPSVGHPGQFRTLELITRKFYWPNMKKTVVAYVQACDSCIRSKHSNQVPAGLLNPIDLPSRPWEEIGCDLITGLPVSEGYDAIFTVVDRFYKMVHYIPTTSKANAVDIANLFVNFIWKLHGLPRKVISDRGPSFIAKFLRQLYTRLGIEPKFSMAYRPQTDGQLERANQFVEIYLCHYINH